MQLLRTIYCLLFGHKAWKFNECRQQTFLIYRDKDQKLQLTVHICRRCGAFYATSGSDKSDALIRITTEEKPMVENSQPQQPTPTE